jgi:uncharacterized protein YfiM (DUF2279 family)
MKKTIPILLLFLICWPAHGDSFLSEDKAKHFLFSSFLTGSISYIAAVNPNVKSERPPAVGCSITLGIGILKEIYDATKPDNRFSVKDLIWDVLGISAGALCMGGLYLK